MEPKAARSPASPFRRCSLAAPTRRVAQSLLAVKKNLEKLTFPLATTTTTTKQLKVFGGKKKFSPAKQEEQEENKFAQSRLHSAGR